MPPEIIDLLSSPDLAPSLPPQRTATTAPPKTSSAIGTKHTQASTGVFIDLDEYSSDIELPALPTQPRILSPVHDALNADKAGGNNKGDSGFVFLDDDFDSTVRLSDSYELSPAKKVRQSPAPQLAKDVASSDPFASSPVAKRVEVKGVVGIPSKPGTASASLKRSLSSLENANGGVKKAAGFKRSKTTLDDDPICWTSSPVVDQLRETAGRRMRGMDLLSKDPFAALPEQRIERSGQSLSGDRGSDVLDSDPFASSPAKQIVVRWNEELNDLEGTRSFANSGFENGNGKGKGKEITVDADSSDSDLPDFNTLISTQSQRVKNPVETQLLKRTSSATALREYQAARKKKDKEAQKSGKAAEKEAEKERKRIAKEEKAKEKAREQELSKVNTLRTDKKVSTPEMIVDLPAGLEAQLEKQVKGFMGTLGVEVTEWESEISNVVRWRRKVIAKYNKEKEYWEPCARHFKVEDHVLVVMKAQEFADLATAEEGDDLDAHVLSIKSKFGDHVIYLIEGLMSWMRKNRNVRNKQYTEAVRRAMETEAAQTKGKGKKKAAEYIDEDSIEDALLELQVLHGVLIHHTNALVETAEWIVAFTQHISTIPYRKEKMVLDTNFCMEVGQVKTGENASDTYVKMLQEIVRITAPIAFGIAAEYPTVQSLMKGLKEKGPECLKSCKKAMNKDGGFSDRDIGVAISKRVYKIFLGRDAGSADV